MAIQSILPPSTNTPAPPKAKEFVSPSPAPSIITTPTQILSNYQIVTNPSKTTVTSRPTTSVQKLTTTSTTTTLTPKQTTTLTFGQKAVQKIKLMSPNQIIPLKQQSTTTTTGLSKQFILKSTTNPTKMNIVTSSQTIRSQPTNKMFTVKTIPASSITAIKPQVTAIVTPSTSSTHQSVGTTQLNISPPKFTIMKPNALSPIVKIAPITRPATHTQPLPAIITTIADAKSSTVPDLSTTNIFDIPIVFADNDGNIQDSTGLTTTIPPATSTMPIVLPASAIDRNVSQLVQNRNIVINSITVPNRAAGGTNKVMLINRTQARPIPNILSRAVPPLKYTKVMVSSPNILSANLAKPIQQTIGKPTIKLNTTGGKFEILSNALIKAPLINTNATSPGTSIAISAGSGGGVTSMTTAVPSSSIVSTIGKFQPIVINVDSDKTTIKNMINVVSQPQTMTTMTTTTPIRKPNTIVIKPGGLKPITSLNTNLLNKNVTVRKVYNIVPHRLGQLVTTTSAGQLTGQIQLQTTQLTKPTSTLTVTTGPGTIISTQANVSTVKTTQNN